MKKVCFLRQIGSPMGFGIGLVGGIFAAIPLAMATPDLEPSPSPTILNSDRQPTQDLPPSPNDTNNPKNTDDTPDEPLSETDSLAAELADLKVGFAGDYPVVFQESGTGAVEGVAVEMWQYIANNLDITHEKFFYVTVEAGFDALRKQEIDVLFGNVDVTPERVFEFDFTQPVGSDAITLLVPKTASLWSIVKPFLGWAFLSSVGLVYLLLFIVGNLLWLAEHRQNPEQFPRRYLSGIREGMWCALATFTTVGYGDRYPITYAGRLIAGWWAVASVVILTTVTAGISTTLAIAFSASGSDKIQRPQDLNQLKIGAIPKSVPAKWARYYHGRIIPITDINMGAKLITEKQVDAIIYPRLSLQSYLSANPESTLRISDFSISEENFNIVLTKHNPLTDQINAELLSVETQIRFHQIVESWFNFNNNHDN